MPCSGVEVQWQQRIDIGASVILGLLALCILIADLDKCTLAIVRSSRNDPASPGTQATRWPRKEGYQVTSLLLYVEAADLVIGSEVDDIWVGGTNVMAKLVVSGVRLALTRELCRAEDQAY